MAPLSDKLKSLGVQTGTTGIQPKPQKPQFPIEAVVEGEFVQNRLGEFFTTRTVYSRQAGLGSLSMDGPVAYKSILQWARLSEDIPLEKVAFFDTETTGLSGGTGTMAFLVGLGYFQGDNFMVDQYFLRSPAEEAAMLSHLADVISQFSMLVSYNGKSFDAPILASRYTISGVPNLIPEKAHLDLLPLARRIWKNRLPSRALSFLEVEILNHPRSEEEVPGWMVPEMYFEYIRHSDARPLGGVFYHNAIDVFALAGLFYFLSNRLEDPLAPPIPDSLDLIAIAKLYEDLDRLDTAMRLYDVALTQGLPVDFRINTLNHLALIAKRDENWQVAVPLWEQTSELGSMDAFIELAKYFEHTAREPRRAMEVVQQAQACLKLLPSQHPAYQKYNRDLKGRAVRLQRSIQ